ncbi:MAG: hypothetical protein KKI02_10680 [Planctomycetes bacterium]|nr:hypothetical protein [Planctomycetota bacterium]
MVSMECASELEPAIASEFDIQTVPESDGDGNTPGVSLPEEAPADWELTIDEGALGLVADAGRDREEDDDSDFGFDGLDDEPDEDNLTDDFDDDDDDLDDDFDDDDDV